MPISSGASGGGGTAKQSRGLPFNVGGTKRSYWPNAASKSSSPISRRRQASGATSFEDNQNRRDTAIKKRSSSRGSVGSSAATSINDLSRDLARPSRVSVDKRQNSNNRRHKQSQVDKYKPIGHISGPSSPASTSPAALRYLVEKQQSEQQQQQQQQATVIINHKANNNRAHRANAASELSGQNQAELKKEEDSMRENQCATVAATAIIDNSKPRKIMNSIGGQLVITGGLTTSQGKQQQQPNQADFSPVIENCANEKNETMKGCKATDQSNTKPSLISSILLGGRGGGFGGNSENCAIKQTSATGAGNNSNRKVKPNLSGKTNYLLGQANYHHNHSVTNMQSSQSSLLNQSLSFNGSGAGGGSSASTSASNSFANLHNNAMNSHHNGLNRTPPATTTLNISKRVNLKYVKSLIILLMSLDLMITIFVHHFSSHDEFAIMFTTHKLRFSVLNLILSAIWFIALIGAIIFDVYPILLLGCLVDIASFILLLVCSIIHFTYRIDYNTVNLTSLLLLLFSIIVLHVYLLVIAALTTYLMLAVKRRKRIQS